MQEGESVLTQATEDKTAFELAIEARVGDAIESIQSMPIDERRKRVEAEYGSPMQVISYWPLIGRRRPLPTLSGEKVDRLLDQALQ